MLLQTVQCQLGFIIDENFQRLEIKSVNHI